MTTAAPTGHGNSVRLAALGALGVVYGDIGTSPLYAIRESFEGSGHELAVSDANVLGVLSTTFWALVIVISIKYLVVVMRADNHGEGGILALTALVTPAAPAGRRSAVAVLVLIGLFGTALLYGDGMITPAISVLSAVEGTSLAAPALEAWVVPLAVVILVGLFAIQRRGTAAIGRLFGPVMLVWFSVLAVLGTIQVLRRPEVLQALDPSHAVRFFGEGGWRAFLALGSIFLVVTGGEALYADMGHFGVRPIRIGWFSLVLPALVLNYFGQGALLLGDPAALENPFYRLVPDAGIVPLVVLATVATVIASQALISGVYSLTMQAVQLGYVPRMRIRHTSEAAAGQIYVPAINWALMVACIGLVVGFGSSTSLAAAYGVAVTMTMVITTLLLFRFLTDRWRWSTLRAGAVCGAFGVVDVAFLGANLTKIPHGGWFPLVVGAIAFTLLTTWRTGRRLLHERLLDERETVDHYLGSAEATGATRVPGTAVYLFSIPDQPPPALVANLQHNRTLHEQVVLLSIVTTDVPRVPPDERSEVRSCPLPGVDRVILRYGFMEDPDVPTGLGEGAAARLRVDPSSATYFLGAESLVVTERPGMAMWRERLFVAMSRNATNAANYFGLPSDRVMTLGSRVEL